MGCEDDWGGDQSNALRAPPQREKERASARSLVLCPFSSSALLVVILPCPNVVICAHGHVSKPPKDNVVSTEHTQRTHEEHEEDLPRVEVVVLRHGIRDDARKSHSHRVGKQRNSPICHPNLRCDERVQESCKGEGFFFSWRRGEGFFDAADERGWGGGGGVLGVSELSQFYQQDRHTLSPNRFISRLATLIEWRKVGFSKRRAVRE
jgi:hypothetical protein